MKTHTFVYVISNAVFGLSSILAFAHSANFTDEYNLTQVDREYICSAQDEGGHRYYATSDDASAAQDQALNDCVKRVRGNCYRTGCTEASRARRGD